MTRPRSCSRAASAARRWLRALAAPHRLHEASDPWAQGSSDCSSDGEGGAQTGRSVVTAAARAGEPRAEAATPTPCAHPLRGPLLRGPAASIFLWLPVAALVCGAGEWRRPPRQALGGLPPPTRASRVLSPHPHLAQRPPDIPRPFGLPGSPRPGLPHRLDREPGAAVAARPPRDRRASALARERAWSPSPPRGQAARATLGSKAPGPRLSGRRPLEKPGSRPGSPPRPTRALGRSGAPHQGHLRLRISGDRALLCWGPGQWAGSFCLL